ncbi:M20/M25/M40 family metallo-hydrolase [Haloarchaeobius litoreus]|uniref:M20/M25/M40 family metallo-hydrolase n=1 Tax=Haloarchaeobius litoreus TaxID=755306 RepID=A0ABD6DE19_9EURY|nr:M20/M25/M40 family metallo-hydrolase [Haloarchaeobius litoreus]
MHEFADRWGEDLREFFDELLRFDTTDGGEAPAMDWLRERFDEFGFETYEWTADAAALAEHPSFPDDPAEIEVADRPSVAGVVEFGDPDAGPTLVLNGHVDVVPATRSAWSSDPFEPVWDGDRMTARGAADMKGGLTACVFAARHLATLAARADGPDLDGRVVVEGVAGEEEGGIGAAAAAMDNPYPFDRDAAIIGEPTELGVVTAVEGSVMKRLRIEGRSAHAATRWRGESVLPHFERVRHAFEELEAEREARIDHPLYEDYPIKWPVCFGTVRAGNWASAVPDELVAEVRIGVAPGETVAGVEAEFQDRLDAVVAESEWLSEHPPTFERFSIQFEPASVDPEDPVVGAVRAAAEEAGLDSEPYGGTFGADSRHYQHAGIPTVLFGPGSIDQAHFPDESIDVREVETAAGVIADAAARFCGR